MIEKRVTALLETLKRGDIDRDVVRFRAEKEQPQEKPEAAVPGEGIPP